MKIAAFDHVEVDCERLFSESGYASAPRRTNLTVRHFERSVLIANVLRSVYFNAEKSMKEFCVGMPKKDGMRGRLGRTWIFSTK